MTHPYPYDAEAYAVGNEHGGSRYSLSQQTGAAWIYWYEQGRADAIEAAEEVTVSDTALESALAELITEGDLSGLISDALRAEGWQPTGAADIRVSTFSDVGMMTYNKGLVISINGSEFQLSIVQSR
jgi:hypothetical protein